MVLIRRSIDVKEKVKQYGIFIMVSLALVGSLSVIGVLQSSERVNTSGIIIQPPAPGDPPSPPPYFPPSPPPEPEIEIDVYSDAGCTIQCASITWGEIEVGGSIDKTIYVMNSGDDDVYLYLAADNWEPFAADGPIQLSWDYDESVIISGAVRELTLSLSISSSITDIETFDFDIVITASKI